MTATASKRFITRERLAISFVVLMIVIIFIGLLAYFWLPGFVKSRVETILSETLHRPVTIQSIDVHLYSLELTINGFRIGEKTTGADANETFFSFEKLHVDLSIESVAHRAPVIGAVALKTPTIRLVREGENQFNISDLVAEFSQPTDDDDQKEATKFSVSNIVIEDGFFELVDRFKQSHQKLSDINLGIPFVANIKSKQASWVEPHFSALVNGSPFLLDGKVRPFTDKREATLDLKLENIDLTAIDEYSPIPTGIHLLSGYFDSDLQITFSQIVDESPAIVISGETALKQLAVHNQAVTTPYQAALENLNVQLNNIDLTGQRKSTAAVELNNIALTRDGETAPVLALQKLTIDDIEIDIAQQQIMLDEIMLDRFNASIRREKEGDIDLLHLIEENPENASLSQTPGLNETASLPETTEPKRTGSVPIPTNKPSVSEIKLTAIPKPGKKPLIAADDKAGPGDATADASSTEDALEQAPTAEQSWTVQINRFILASASFQFEDLALPDVSPMVIDPFNLTLTDIDMTGKKPLALLLQAKVNQHGSIDTKGSLAWAPLAADIETNLKAVDLVALQGWAGDQFNAILTRGAISFQGKIQADGEPIIVSVSGDGQFSDFNVFDQVNTSDLLSWKSLAINKIDFVNEPLRVGISSIELDNFFARVGLLPDGDLNFNKLAKQNEKVTSPQPAEQQKPTNTATSSPEVLPIRVDKVTLKDGNVKFTDQFIKPNYRANLTGLSGEIGPFHPNNSVKVGIQGAVDKSAPLKIHGNFNPFSSDIQLDVTAKVHDIDMPTFSPYSGKHIGYPIDKGKLSVDLHYHIVEGALTAENNVFLDQLTLGEQIDSPDAPSLPLDLAITLLKNRQGEIDIHLPIEGSINDPQFSLGGIVFDAFINLIMKAVTAPFALLGSVLGDGEEMSVINFSAGQAKIEEEAEHRLQVLSEALIDRPSLELEITGYADQTADTEGLKRVILDREVKAMKLTDDAKKGIASGSLEDVTFTPEEYEKFLTKVYKAEDFKKQKNFLGITKSLPVKEMEQLILTHIEISDDQLQTLAEKRAKAARSWLIEQDGIASENIFVLGGKTKSAPEGEAHGGQVEFSLK